MIALVHYASVFREMYTIMDTARRRNLAVIEDATQGIMFKKEIFIVHNRRIGFKPYIQEVSGIEAVDIDGKKDYDEACRLAESENWIS